MELKQQVLEKEITKINNNFQSIINSSKISNDKTQSLREGLQLNVNTCSLLSAAENLLSLTSELKEIHLFYNLQLFYWHFLEILWLFIFLVLYLWFLKEISI